MCLELGHGLVKLEISMLKRTGNETDGQSGAIKWKINCECRKALESSMNGLYKCGKVDTQGAIRVFVLVESATCATMILYAYSEN
jgi:hypothetical protein